MGLKSLNMAVNNYCNNRCQMCNIWENDVVDTLTAEEISRHLAAPRSELESVVELSLTGGEPFMRRDLAEVTHAIVEHLPALETLFVNTNGTYPKRTSSYAKVISGIVPHLTICVSIDGDRETHRVVRGVDSWDLCVKTIEGVNGLGLPNVSCLISTTLLGGAEAVPILDSIRTLADEHACDFTFRFASVSTHYYGNEAYTVVDVTAEQVDEIARFVQEHKPDDVYLPVLMEHLRTGSNRVMIGPGGENRCRAGDVFLFVQADGVVRPCIYSTREMGSLSEGLRGRRLVDLGDHEPCPCCTECTVYPMTAFSEESTGARTGNGE